MAQMHSDSGSRSAGGGGFHTRSQSFHTPELRGEEPSRRPRRSSPDLTSLAPRLNASVRAPTGCDASGAALKLEEGRGSGVRGRGS